MKPSWSKLIYVGLTALVAFASIVTVYLQYDFVASLIRNQTAYEDFIASVILTVLVIALVRFRHQFRARLNLKDKKEVLEGVVYNTHLNFWEIVVLGWLFTAIFYLAIFSVDFEQYPGFIVVVEKLAFRGFIPIITASFFFMVISICLLKFLSIFQIRQAYKYANYLVLAGNNDFGSSPYPQLRDSFLTKRASMLESLGTDHHEQQNEYFADLDREELSSSYTFIRFLIWGIPVLGFLGTVWGISESISAFTVALGQTNVAGLSADLLKPALDYLSVAFDTTLAALSFGLVAMFCASFMQKIEESLLSKCHILLSGTRISSHVIH